MFELSSSGEIVISAKEMTGLLWRDLEEDMRFDVKYESGEQDSFDFVVDGNCIFEGNNHFEINWSISHVDGSNQKEFFYEGDGLNKARKAISGSIDSMLSPVILTTNPDSVSVTIDGKFVGPSPLILKDIPFGWHTFATTTPDGIVFVDSFHLTPDTTIFHFTLPVEPEPEFAFLKLLSPPKCELYVNGNHVAATYNLIYKLTPGEAQLRLVSPQYGARNLTLPLVAGDTASLGFFTPIP